MPIKVNITYAESGPGWSETYYHTADNPTDYLSFSSPGVLSLGSPAGQFVLKRLPTLTNRSAIQHIRASKVSSPQITLSAFLPFSVGQGTFTTVGGEPGGSAEVFAKLLIRVQCGQVKRRSLWLGGIPEEVVHSPSTYIPTANWNDVLFPFLGWLKDGSYGIVGRLPVAGPPIAQQILSFVTAPTSIGATIQPSPTNAPLGGYCYVVIRGVKYPRGWNGVHRGYNNLLGTNIQIGPLKETQHTVPPWDSFAGGTIQLMTFVISPFTSAFAEYLTHRKVGRPFGESRGRVSFR